MGVETAVRIALMVVLVGCVVVTDVKSRLIPNKLTFPFAFAGFGLHAVTDFPHGLFIAGIGFLVGFAIFFLPFLMDAMGAGDIKLMAALGAITNAPAILCITLFTALSGGVIIIVLRLRAGELKKTIKRMGQLHVFYFYSALYVFTKDQKHLDLKEANRLEMTDEKIDYIPYGVAIACGTLITVGLFIWGDVAGLYL